jgi:hypothetical protein
MRKRRGSLNDQEMDDELWGDNTTDDLFKKKVKVKDAKTNKA